MDMNELSDIRTQFYSTVERYPAVYANHNANPHLPSAMKDHDKMEANLTALYRRMYAYQGEVEKHLDHQESVMNKQTNDNARLNAMLAKKSAFLDGKDALIAMQNPMVQEPFTVRQMPGCSATLDKFGKPINCPCVKENESRCSSTCNEKCTTTANQISIVEEAKSIEKTTYMYGIARIVYLLVGIVAVSYFVLQTVTGPDSTILADAKTKAEQVKTMYQSNDNDK
jgi:hypothetical protein